MLFSVMELYNSKHGEYFRVGCRVHLFMDFHEDAEKIVASMNENFTQKSGTIFELLLSDRSDICDFCGIAREVLTWNN